MAEFEQEKKLFVALDVPESGLRSLIVNTTSAGAGGYFIPGTRALDLGLSYIADNIRIVNGAVPLIYDHQTAGSDISENAKKFMSSVQSSGINKVVIYPSTDLEGAQTWIESGVDHQLDVIVGKELTSETPPTDERYDDIYRLAAKLGIREFMLPGNKPDRIKHYRQVIEEVLSKEPYTIYAAGFGNRRGTIPKFARAAGVRNGWGIIVGRDIHQSSNTRESAEAYIDRIRKSSGQ